MNKNKKTNKKTDITPRHAAAISVFRCTGNMAFSNLEIASTISNNSFSSLDISFYTMLVHGTLERLRVLDYFLDELVYDGIEKTDLKTRAVLRVGAYQLLFTDRIPVSAICNEAVNTATNWGLRSGGLINAVLRKAAKEVNTFLSKLESLPEDIKYSISPSIYELIKSQYKDRTSEILKAVFEISSLKLRVNTLKTSVEDLLEEIQDAERDLISDFGIRCYEPAGVVLDKVGNRAFIQGSTSQYAIQTLMPREGQVVIDVCACPGGKSFAAAMMMNNIGRVISLDLHKNKLNLIDNGAEFLGTHIISTRQNDARFPIEEYFSIADCVVCDVPCSGLGEMNTKPEIRYKNAEDFERLPEIQYDILMQSVKYLKNGGKILYSTCTINNRENEEVVRRFLKTKPSFSILRERKFLFDSDGEGFYICILSESSGGINEKV